MFQLEPDSPKTSSKVNPITQPVYNPNAIAHQPMMPAGMGMYNPAMGGQMYQPAPSGQPQQVSPQQPTNSRPSPQAVSTVTHTAGQLCPLLIIQFDSNCVASNSPKKSIRHPIYFTILHEFSHLLPQCIFICIHQFQCVYLVHCLYIYHSLTVVVAYRMASTHLLSQQYC